MECEMNQTKKLGPWSGFLVAFFLFLYSFQVFSKTIIISDIDDTIKKANSAGKFPEQAYHFLKKIPYFEMRDLFNEINSYKKSKQEATAFYYVSAAFSFTFDAQAWLQKNHFPAGRSSLKGLKNKESTYDFKHAVIKNILELEAKTLDPKTGETLHVLMFGDNAQIDALVYSDLTREMSLDSHIYIRDVRAEATFFDSTLPVKQIAGVTYYFSEIELFNNPEFSFLSTELLLRTRMSYAKRDIVPNYTLLTLNRRLQSLYNDKVRAHDDALKFWNDYYSRF
jgi:hypothetical protein